MFVCQAQGFGLRFPAFDELMISREDVLVLEKSPEFQNDTATIQNDSFNNTI
jgi:hypothetical protein